MESAGGTVNGDEAVDVYMDIDHNVSSFNVVKIYFEVKMQIPERVF